MRAADADRLAALAEHQGIEFPPERLRAAAAALASLQPQLEQLRAVALEYLDPGLEPAAATARLSRPAP